MVDQETFDQVQQILQKHGFKHSKPNEEPSYDNLLRELLICGKSGKPMYIDSKARYTCSFCKNRFYSAEIKKCTKCTRKLEQKAIDSVYKVRYYMCYTGFEHTFIIDGKKKKSRSISSEYIESLVDAELSKLYISDGLFEVLKKRLHFLWDEKNSEINEKKKRVRKDIDKFDEDISRIMEKKWKTLDMSEKSEDEVNEVIEEKRQRISILEKELRGIREQTEEEFDRTWEALNVLLRAKTVF